MTGSEPSRALIPVLVLIGMVTAVVSSLGAPLLPTIARADHVSLGDAQWSLTITMLVGAVAAPICGRLGDGPYRREVILLSMGGVVLGSVLAALPGGGFLPLLIGRGLHGLGLGLMPLTMAVARDVLPEARSTPAIAMLSVSSAAGLGLGYPVTGLLDDAFGLHAPFWFGAAVASAALAAAVPVIPVSRHLSRRPLDLVGAGLLTLALVALLLGLTEGQPWGWYSARVVGLIVTGLAGFAAWAAWERRTTHPLVDLRLLRHGTVAATNAAALLVSVAVYMFVPVFTDFVQAPRSAGYGFAVSVVVTGSMLVPFSFLSTAMSRVSAAIGARVGHDRVVPIGALVTTVAVGWLAVGGHNVWEGFVDMGFLGIGSGFTFAAMPGLIIRSVPPEETGSALGFYQVVRYVGFSLGSGVGASLLAAYTPVGHRDPTRAGFTAAFAVGAAVALSAALLSALVGGRNLRPAPTAAATALEATATAEGAGAEVLFE